MNIRLAAALISIFGMTPVCAFGLTLDEAYRLALQHNEKIKISEEEVAASRERIRLQRSAVLPTLSTSVAQSRNREAGVGGFATFPNNREIRIDVDQPLYGGGKEWAALRAVKVMESISREQVTLAKQALLIDVAVAYFALLRAQDQLTVTQRALDLAKEQMELALARKEAGTATRTEVVRSEVEVTKARTDLVRAENAVRTGRAKLGFLIGQPVGGAIADVNDAPVTLENLETLVRQAMSSRADYRASLLTLRVAEEGVKIARAKFLPTARLTGNVSHTEHVTAFRDNANWQVQAKVEYDIFEGFGRNAEYEQAKIVLRQATLKQMYLAREIEMDVQEALLDIEAIESIRVAAENEVRLARENYERMTAQFREGLSTAVEAADAHTALIAAEVQQATAGSDLKLARRRLDFALGTLGEKYLKGDTK